MHALRSGANMQKSRDTHLQFEMQIISIDCHVVMYLILIVNFLRPLSATSTTTIIGAAIE